MKEMVVDCMTLEPEQVEKVLDDHKKTLCEHTEKITDLQIKSERFDEKLNSIENQMTDVKGTLVRFENNYLQTTNSMMNSLSQVVINTSNNSTELTKTNNMNRKDIIIKTLTIVGGIIGVLILGYFAAKGISVSIPIF